MSSYTQVFGGDIIYPAYVSYLAISLTEDQTLSWPSDFQNGKNSVAAIMDVSPSAGGFTLTLPDARQASVGQSFLINNKGSYTFGLLRNDGSTLLSPVNTGTSSYFYLTNNTTAAGQWSYSPWGAGGTSITSIGLDPAGTSGNIVVSPAYPSVGNPITTTGVFDLSLGEDLGALAGFGSGLGIAARTSTSPNWTLISIAGTANQINILNPTGVTGNPTISLAPNITGIQSVTAGNIMVGGTGGNANNISATNAGGSINFSTTSPVTGAATFTLPIQLNAWTTKGGTIEFNDPTNTHLLSLSGGNMTSDIPLVLPSVAPTLNQVLSCISAGPPGQLGWANVTTFGGSSTLNAIAKYTDTSGSLGNSGVIIDGSNNITGANSFTLPQLSLNNNLVSTLGVNQALILAPNGTGGVQIPGGSVSIPGLSFTGATNTGMYTPGGSTINFSVLGVKQLEITSTASAVNSIQLTGSISGSPVKISATGTDSNISVQINPVGTGSLLNAVGTSANPSYSFTGDAGTGMYREAASTISWSTGSTRQMTLDASGNLGLGATTFGTSAANVISLKLGTEPASSVSNSLQIFASDALSAGNQSIGWYGGGNGGVSAVSPTAPNRTIAVKINGTTYYLAAKTTNN